MILQTGSGALVLHSVAIASTAGKLVRAEAYRDEQGQVGLRWWTDRYTLSQPAQWDGPYLLVTNHCSLSAQRMFGLYHDKDGVEKRIQACKQDLKVSPLYLHKDERIEAMFLVDMLALLAYSLFERQVPQRGPRMTTRRIIAALESLYVVITLCADASQLYRLTPMEQEQAAPLQLLADVLAELCITSSAHPLLPGIDYLPSGPPGHAQPTT